MINISIVPAQPENAQALTEISISAKRHWNYPDRWIELWISGLTILPEYISSNETWMAIINNKIVAYYSLKYDHLDLWLDNLWVLPEFIGQGIGQQIFRHMLERSRLKNEKILKIEADPNAVGFYSKMGAHLTGEHQSELDGQSRILPIMEINL